jgi:hypothetical protein
MQVVRWGERKAVRVAAWGLAGLGVVVLLAVVAWLVWKVPPALYAYVSDPKDRADAEASTRTGIIAGLAGLAALGSLAMTTRTHRLTQHGHFIDRYTKAIEQLGSDTLVVRLGGIYALERIAVDSRRDQLTVVEVLSAFIREHPASAPLARPTKRKTAHPLSLSHRANKLSADVQAALTVLGRLPHRPDISRGDLSGASLPRARLTGANLSGAQLTGVNLTGAGLIMANLTGTRFFMANLTGAWLTGANLTGARFIRANLTGAILNEANLTGAKLYEADLTDAHVTQQQLDAALGNDATTLPVGLTRPQRWPRSNDDGSPSLPPER